MPQTTKPTVDTATMIGIGMGAVAVVLLLGAAVYVITTGTGAQLRSRLFGGSAGVGANTGGETDRTRANGANGTCPEHIKLCSDGSSLKMVGENCEFPLCPGEVAQPQ